MRRRRLEVAFATLALAPHAALADMLKVPVYAIAAQSTLVNCELARPPEKIAVLNVREAERGPYRAVVDADDQAARAERVAVAGLIEVEAAHEFADDGGDSSNTAGATIELALDAQISDWIAAEVVAKFEDETDSDGKFEFDTAMFSVAHPEGPWFVNAGKYTLPFGVYPSYMISDPLTLELGETRATSIEAGLTAGGAGASVFLFKSNRKDEAAGFGLAAHLDTEIAGAAVRAHLSYLTDLAESDSIVDRRWVAVGDARVPAWVLSGEFEAGAIILIAEILAARKPFRSAGDEKPSAWTLEGAYRFSALGRPAVAALGLQRSQNTLNANWDLPRKRVIGGLFAEIVDDISAGLEFKRDEDTEGDAIDTVTARVAIEF